jgi:hypothetical protein
VVSVPVDGVPVVVGVVEDDSAIILYII